MFVCYLNACIFVSQELVDKLYEYRDHYCDTYGVEKAAQRDKDVQVKMEETLKQLEALKGTLYI